MTEPREFELMVSGLAAREVTIIGLGKVRLPAKVSVEPDKVRTLRVLVTVARPQLKSGSQPVTFTVGDPVRHETRIVDTVFVSGGNRHE